MFESGHSDSLSNDRACGDKLRDGALTVRQDLTYKERPYRILTDRNGKSWVQVAIMQTGAADRKEYVCGWILIDNEIVYNEVIRDAIASKF